MRSLLHGEAYVKDFSELKELFEAFNSCKRFCYSRLVKDGLRDPRKLASAKYKNSLNTRWISDAANEASGVYARLQETGDFKVIFGGRKAWEAYRKGSLSKDEWLTLRSKTLYARGDKTKIGNPNLRITEKGLRITVGNKDFKFYPFHISKRKRARTVDAEKTTYTSDEEQLRAMLDSGIAYNVRLIRRVNDPRKIEVVIDYEAEGLHPTYGFENGILGIDTNPDRIALAFLDPTGNLLKTQTLINNRLLYGQSPKRLNDLGLLIKKLIQMAKANKLAIVFENLKFNKDVSAYSKHLRRLFSNFVWKKFLEVLEHACQKNRIPYKKVNPAYTSFIGKLKYQKMHRITIHEAAAYVIGRRGLGCQESPSIFGIPRSLVKQRILRTLEGKYQEKRIHNWTMWNILKKDETVLTELQDKKLSYLKEPDGGISRSCDVGEIPTGKSSTKTGRRGEIENNFKDEERRPKEAIDSNGFLKPGMGLIANDDFTYEK